MMGRQKGMIGNEGEISVQKTEMCLPLHPSAALMQDKKRGRWEQISGVYPSHCFSAHLRLEISAAGGDGLANE